MKNFTNLKGDIIGGLIAGIIALPLALAFGIASGLGATAGLWGAIVLGFFASIFGGTKMQISGPTGPMSVVAAAIAVQFAGDIASIMAVFVMTGLFQILFAFLRLGKLVKFIPYSVISGFMTGVGFIIILLQINPMLGVKSVGSTILAVQSLPQTFANMNYTALAYTLATLAILYLTPKKIAKILPTPLLAILLLTPLSVYMHANIAIIGEIPTGFATFTLPMPKPEYLSLAVMYAAMLAVLGSIDSLLTSLVADSLTKTKHRSNQELFGQGLGNALVGFFGGIPGAGATMRTVANIKAGGLGRLSGATHSIFLLLVVLIFAPIVKYVPLPVLAGILIKVGIDILDYRLLKRLKFIPKKDLVVMFIVFFLTIFVDLIFAVGIGVGLAWVLYQTGVPRKNRKFNINILNDGENEKFVEINGPMYFATNAKILGNLNTKSSQTNLTIDCSKVTFMDISSVYSLQDFIDTVDKNHTKINIIIDDEHLSGNAINELKYILRDNIIEKDKIGEDEPFSEDVKTTISGSTVAHIKNSQNDAN
ncbi:MAG: SulP family inorganic anion transporter [Campylobacter sp.]|nr:SulP family inorganic anion transporter [Campylobacter sp.]